MGADRFLRVFSRTTLVGALVAAFVGGTVGRAGAEEGGEETLKTLYRIAISAEMCGFPMGQREATNLGKAMNRALAETNLSPDAADALYRDVDAALEAEGFEKICAGDGARNYRALLAANIR